MPTYIYLVILLIAGAYFCTQGAKLWAAWLQKLGVPCWDKVAHPHDLLDRKFFGSVGAYALGILLLFGLLYHLLAQLSTFFSHIGP